MTARFCENCGSALGTGDAFCGECGQTAQAPGAAPASPQPPAPQAAAPQPPAPAPQPPAPQAPAPAPSPAAPTPAATTFAPAPKTSRSPVLIGIAAAVVVAAAGGWWFLLGPGSASAATQVASGTGGAPEKPVAKPAAGSPASSQKPTSPPKANPGGTAAAQPAPPKTSPTAANPTPPASKPAKTPPKQTPPPAKQVPLNTGDKGSDPPPPPPPPKTSGGDLFLGTWLPDDGSSVDPKTDALTIARRGGRLVGIIPDPTEGRLEFRVISNTKLSGTFIADDGTRMSLTVESRSRNRCVMTVVLPDGEVETVPLKRIGGEQEATQET